MFRSTSVVITTIGASGLTVVTGQQPDAGGAVPLHQVGILLVRQRLDRGGVEALAAVREREENRNRSTIVCTLLLARLRAPPEPASMCRQASRW